MTKEARFTVRALDEGFLVTEEEHGLDDMGLPEWKVKREVGCASGDAVESVLAQWDWQKAVGATTKAPAPSR